MNKWDLNRLALIGMSAGLALSGCQNTIDDSEKKKSSDQLDDLSTDMETFFRSLSPKAQKKFRKLDAQHKMMAVEMADQKCHGRNSCAGMGGCSTADHECAAMNECKGHGGAPVRDADKAVEIQYQKQMENSQKQVKNKPTQQKEDQKSPSLQRCEPQKACSTPDKNKHSQNGGYHYHLKDEQ